MEHSYSWEGFKDIALDIRAKNFFKNDTESSIMTESWKRVFVARIYYACFHKAVEIAEDITSIKKLPPHLGFYYDKNTAHGSVQAFYKKLAKYPLPRTVGFSSFDVSTDLKKLHDMRKECDYAKELVKSDDVESDIECIDFYCNESFKYLEQIESNLLIVKNHFYKKKSK